ncbi:hypothetical protein NHX12_011008, partial [Muraenolepis orangiensis]
HTVIHTGRPGPGVLSVRTHRVPVQEYYRYGPTVSRSRSTIGTDPPCPGPGVLSVRIHRVPVQEYYRYGPTVSRSRGADERLVGRIGTTGTDETSGFGSAICSS